MSAAVFRSLEEAHGRFGPCALAIGNFDGVHIGHRALLNRMLAFVAAEGGTPAVLTFHPHPTVVVAPERTPPMITTLEERVRLLEAAGAERILVLPFTEELSLASPAEFVEKILVDALETKAVFVGDNFRFGHRQAGTSETLAELAKRNGFEAHFVKPVSYRGEVVSSSAVRCHVDRGNVARAGRLLGRCFSIAGPVVSGHGIGSKQTVPTLNLRPVENQILPRGVFITETVETGRERRWPSITNVGWRPTFGGEEVTIETFLLSKLGSPTPEQIAVDFRRFVRAERTFANPDELKAQILKDVGRAQAYWRRVERFRRQHS